MSNHAHRRYQELHEDVEEWIPGFDVPLLVGNAKEFPECRNMAYCTYRVRNDGKKDIAIVVGPRLLRGSPSRVEAVLRHELAHAVEFHLGEKGLRDRIPVSLPRGPERRADRVAELLWGDPIYYDDILVQTLDGGLRPRPRHLGP